MAGGGLRAGHFGYRDDDAFTTAEAIKRIAI